jgi:hypothetical protein
MSMMIKAFRPLPSFGAVAAQQVPPAQPAPPESVDDRGDASRLLRYASNLPVPVLGSLAQGIYGGVEIAKAKSGNARFNGIVDATGGIAGVFNDLTNVALFASPVLHLSPHLLAVSGPINGISGIFGGVLDGGRDIANAIHHHDKTDAIIGSAKIGVSGVGCAAAWMGNIPVNMAMTGLYLGLVAYQNRDSFSDVWRLLRKLKP